MSGGVFPLGHLGFTLAAAEFARARGLRVPSSPTWAILVGAMLPDMVDKPLGHGFLDWGAGRLWGHSILFVILLAGLAYAMRGRDQGIAGGLAFGSAFHLVFDRMWEIPDVLFWPLLGTSLPQGDFEVADWVTLLLEDAYVQTTELMGLVLLLWVARRGFARRTARVGADRARRWHQNAETDDASDPLS